VNPTPYSGLPSATMSRIARLARAGAAGLPKVRMHAHVKECAPQKEHCPPYQDHGTRGQIQKQKLELRTGSVWNKCQGCCSEIRTPLTNPHGRALALCVPRTAWAKDSRCTTVLMTSPRNWT
jgi:hypothetical protein